jgi:hypothetical protein
MPRQRRDGALDALLCCAASRAGASGLTRLRVDTGRVSAAALLAVVRAHGGALRELRTCARDAYYGLRADDASALVAAAPRLTLLDVESVTADGGAAVRRLQLLLPTLTLRGLCVTPAVEDSDENFLPALGADMAAHASLTSLELSRVPLKSYHALEAVVDVALSRRLRTLVLCTCGVAPAGAPALARLLRCGDALTTLVFSAGKYERMFDMDAARVLGAALRENATLTALTFTGRTHLFRDDVAIGCELLSALTGHASLRTLVLWSNVVGHRCEQEVVGAALGALIAANAPALTQLDVSYCHLGATGLRLLFHALRHNTHLRELDCSLNGVDGCELYRRMQVGNTSLRVLRAHNMLYVV